MDGKNSYSKEMQGHYAKMMAKLFPYGIEHGYMNPQRDTTFPIWDGVESPLDLEYKEVPAGETFTNYNRMKNLAKLNYKKGNKVKLTDAFINSPQHENWDAGGKEWLKTYRGKVLGFETINGVECAHVDAGPDGDRNGTWAIEYLTKA